MLEHSQNSHKKSERDSNLNNNQSSNHNAQSEQDDHDLSSDNTIIKGDSDNEQFEKPMFLFKVKKLGKKGYTHKSRLLFITPENISYYQMVDKKEKNQNFLNLLNSLYRVIKNNDYDHPTYKKMLEAFIALPKEEKILKGSFKTYDIVELNEYGSFKKAPIRIVNLDVPKQEQTNTRNFWIMEAREVCFRNKIMESKKIITDYLEDSEMSLEKNPGEISTKIMTNKNKKKIGEDNIEFEKGTKLIISTSNKDINEIELVKKRTKSKYILSEDKDKIHYIGIFFQGFVKEYYEHINKTKKHSFQIDLDKKKNNNEEKARKDAERKIKDTKKQLYLELAIYYCYNIFVKHCEKVVMKIISDLNTFKTNRDILKPGKLHPIVFPNPFSLTQENTAVLLYSIWGVNYTLTWNSLKGKFNGILTKTKGNWKGVKNNYKQKNCFQDLLTKLSTICSNINKFPSIPLDCIIDYNGFRVYCESDIFADEECLKGLELVQNESTAFIRELTKYICENSDDLEKEYPKQNSFCNISNELIANEKALDFEKSLEGILNDFLRSFPSGKVGEINKDLKFYKTEEKMINIVKNMISDTNVIEDPDDNFSIYFADSGKKQIKYEFFYLMNFNVSVPILDENITLNNRIGNIFYREELIIENINFDKYQMDVLNEVNKIKNKEKVFFYGSEEENEEEIEKSRYQYSNESDEDYNEEEDSDEISRRRNKSDLENSMESLDDYEKEEDQEKSNTRFLEIISKNTYQNNPGIENSLYQKFQIKFQNLLMALDSFYFIPYNSETLKICFHYFGINLCYLGKVAEKTTIPHIRELCLIEMFARVSKKIIFDLLAQSVFEKATDAFYSNIKKIMGYKYLIPFALKENYGGDYLTMSTLPVEEAKFPFYDGIELKGLYLQNDEYPFKDINEDNPRNKENNEDMFDINHGNKNENVINFFNLLLGNTLVNNNKLILYDKEINNTKELWDFIMDEIREQYYITDEDIFIYCNLDSISILPLISAIQYHTGIKFKNESGSIFDKVVNHKFSRNTFEEFFVSPKISYNNFSYFLCKENIILPLRNNFGMHYPGRRIYYEAKLNYYAEQYLFRKKISQNYFYLFYLKILKGWDTYDTKKISGGGTLLHNLKKEFNKNMAINSINQDQISPLFEDNFDSFIILMLSQYQPKYQKGAKKLYQTLNKIDNNNLINFCERIITINWNNKHPFMCILYSTYAKALYKNTSSREKENIIDSYFFNATEIARNSLGELNIFYGKLTRDIGLFYEKNLKFKDAHKMFSFAYKVFFKHKKRFKREYFYTLKHLVKNCVNLGQLQEGLDFGYQLVQEIAKEKPTELDLNIYGESIIDLKIGNDEEYEEKIRYYFWDKIHNMDGFTFNLVKIAKELKEYDTGVKLGNLLFKIIIKIHKHPIDYVFKNYKNWLRFSEERIADLNRIKNKQNNNKNEFQSKNEIKLKDYGKIKEKTIDNFINLYLKCLFRGLKGIENKVLARAYIGFIENCKEPSLVNASKEEIDEKFYKLFFRDNGETFEEHFKNKILYFLLKKYKVGSINSVEIQKNYNMSKYDLEIIYFKFPKGESKLFDM